MREARHGGHRRPHRRGTIEQIARSTPVVALTAAILGVATLMALAVLTT